MNAIRYERPETLDEAVRLLTAAGDRGRVLAGGTDLLVALRRAPDSGTHVVDVKKIPELVEIAPDGGGFRIGAAVCGAALSEHAALCAAWPGVVEAAGLIGSQQIQGRASLGGNLCNASPAADTVPALIAADARCTVVGPSGRRDVPVAEIATAPGETSLGPGELVVDLRLPARPARSSDAYLRLTPRTEMDIAVVGAGVSVTLDGDGSCTAARVAIGAVGPRAILVTEAGEALIGSRLDATALERVATLAAEAATPIDDVRGTVAYRRRVAGVLARRAVAIAGARASQ